MTTAAIFLLLAAGNCKVWTEFTNRVHAKKWPCRTLRRVRWLHDAGIVVGCVAAWFVATRLAGRSAVGPFGWLLVAVWAVGLGRLLADAARHLRRKTPDGVSVESSRVIDVAAELGELPTGDGDLAWLARMPLNQSFQIEVTHKTFAHPAYPAAEPLRILHLTDWHFSGTPDKRFYERAAGLCGELDYDLAVFTGDLVDRLSLLEWLPDTLGRIDAPLGRYFVLGNHDWMAGLDETRDAMVAAGWMDLGGKAAEIEHAGGRFLLTGDERPWADGPPADSADDAFEIVLAHTPDRLTEAWQRDAGLVLAGHNHGGQVVLPVLGPVYSPSRHGVRYAAGCFRRGDTLMHVGRGLGGIHPLRINCRPEVTVVTLTGR